MLRSKMFALLLAPALVLGALTLGESPASADVGNGHCVPMRNSVTGVTYQPIVKTFLSPTEMTSHRGCINVALLGDPNGRYWFYIQAQDIWDTISRDGRGFFPNAKNDDAGETWVEYSTPGHLGVWHPATHDANSSDITGGYRLIGPYNVALNGSPSSWRFRMHVSTHAQPSPLRFWSWLDQYGPAFVRN